MPFMGFSVGPVHSRSIRILSAASCPPPSSPLPTSAPPTRPCTHAASSPSSRHRPYRRAALSATRSWRTAVKAIGPPISFSSLTMPIRWRTSAWLQSRSRCPTAGSASTGFARASRHQAAVRHLRHLLCRLAKVYPAARLAQTIGMEEATIYVVDIPTCGGHCLPGLPDPVPSGAFAELPVKIPNACKLVKALVDHLQPRSLVLLGFSTGGHLAYTLANEHGSELPLKGIGLIHPAGDCLSDKLLDIIGSGSMKEWPFDWEEVRVKEDICTETRLCSNIAPSSCVTDSGCSLLTHFSLRRPIARCCITTGAAA